MRIGIFTDCYYPQVNGVVTSVLMLEEELIKLGHEVTIITVKVPNHIEEKNNILRVSSIPFIKWSEFRLAVPFHLDILRQIKNMNFDLIHTHTEFSVGLLGKYMAKLYNIPSIHTYHTMYEDYTHYIYNLKYGKNFVRNVIKKTSMAYVKQYDGVIAPTDKTYTALRSYGVTNDIYVVPTGIDLKQFARYPKNHPVLQDIYEQWGLSKDHKIILSLGRISEEKSVHTIIHQLPALLEHDPNIRLIIVGDGPYRAKLEKLVEKLYISDYVIFVGQVPFDEVSYYYSIADVFVSASQTETQGLTIMEAMATEIPVIVYDDLNIKGIVIDNISGRLFKSEEELSQKLLDCFANEEESKRLAKKGQLIVRSLSKEAYGKNAENVYIKLVNQSVQVRHRLNA